MGNEQAKLSPEEIKNRDIQKMDSELKRKLQRGVTYNMKVIIRGERNTGKTCLTRRLQGQGFSEQYIPSAKIEITTINWNYKASDDLVKVEVWDVVDQAKKRPTSAILPPEVAQQLRPNTVDDEDDEAVDDDDANKLANAGAIVQGSHTIDLDASMIDVYKDAHAVILVFDITKKWTFDYVKRELDKVPNNVEVLVLANYRDLGDKRIVTFEELHELCSNPAFNNRVRGMECSMKNCYGLKQLYTYFNLPFLKLKRDILMKQLHYLDQEMQQSVAEVDIVTKEQNYEEYLQWAKETRKRKPAPKPPSLPTSPVNNGGPIVFPTQPNAAAPVQVVQQQPRQQQHQQLPQQQRPQAVVVNQTTITPKAPTPLAAQTPAQATVKPSAPAPEPTPTSAPAVPAPAPTPAPTAAPTSALARGSSFLSRFIGGGSAPAAKTAPAPVAKQAPQPVQAVPTKPPTDNTTMRVKSPDDFYAGDLDDGFFGPDDSDEDEESEAPSESEESSDDDYNKKKSTKSNKKSNKSAKKDKKDNKPKKNKLVQDDDEGEDIVVEQVVPLAPILCASTPTPVAPISTPSAAPAQKPRQESFYSDDEDEAPLPAAKPAKVSSPTARAKPMSHASSDDEDDEVTNITDTYASTAITSMNDDDEDDYRARPMITPDQDDVDDLDTSYSYSQTTVLSFNSKGKQSPSATSAATSKQSTSRNSPAINSHLEEGERSLDLYTTSSHNTGTLDSHAEKEDGYPSAEEHEDNSNFNDDDNDDDDRRPNSVVIPDQDYDSASEAVTTTPKIDVKQQAKASEAVHKTTPYPVSLENDTKSRSDDDDFYGNDSDDAAEPQQNQLHEEEEDEEEVAKPKSKALYTITQDDDKVDGGFYDHDTPKTSFFTAPTITLPSPASPTAARVATPPKATVFKYDEPEAPSMPVLRAPAAEDNDDNDDLDNFYNERPASRHQDAEEEQADEEETSKKKKKKKSTTTTTTTAEGEEKKKKKKKKNKKDPSAGDGDEDAAAEEGAEEKKDKKKKKKKSSSSKSKSKKSSSSRAEEGDEDEHTRDFYGDDGDDDDNNGYAAL